MRTKSKLLRLSPEEDQAWREGAKHYRTTVTGFVRKAVRSVLSQRPVLSPTELDEIYKAREQFRRAGYNLDALLRQVYLTQLGVTVRGPEAEEFRGMLAELRQATAHYTAMLAKFP
jgi:hypothetical protein